MVLKIRGSISFYDFAKAKERFNKSTNRILKDYNVMGIYGIYLDDTLVYIGQSKNIKNRWIQHKQQIEAPLISFEYKESGIDALYNTLRQYYREGIESIYFCILEIVKDESKLKKLETEYINFFKPKYNLRH